MKNISKKTKIRYTFDYKDRGKWIRSICSSRSLKSITDLISVLGVLEKSKYRIIKLTEEIEPIEEIVK